MTVRRRAILVGAKGQVAQALARAAGAADFDIEILARPDFDLAQPAAIAAAIRAAGPHVVINPAAYTAVDKAEDEPDLAHAINAAAAGIIAKAAADVGAPVIHYSTDYVFDGTARVPYREGDPTGPTGVYGASKLAGEQAVAAVNQRHIILRTAWVCSADGANFLKTMLRLAAERPRLRVVDDQHGSPTFAADIADATWRIASSITDATSPSAASGVFHLVSHGATTWCGFAREIMAQSALRGGPSVPVDAITTAEFPTKARRPAYSCLDTGKVAAVFGLTMPDWHDSLGRCLDQLVGRPLQSGQKEGRSA